MAGNAQSGQSALLRDHRRTCQYIKADGEQCAKWPRRGYDKCGNHIGRVTQTAQARIIQLAREANVI